MTDVLTREQRSRCMSRIRGKNTKPELAVRKMIHGMGFRYLSYRNDLPGRQDLVFPGLMNVIFVHGCFWRMHNCRYGRTKPSTKPDFWENKRQATKAKDIRNIKDLKKTGWVYLYMGMSDKKY